MDFLGKPIQEIKDSQCFKRRTKLQVAGGAPAIELCDFEEVVTKSGNPKGRFHTCKERGFQAFTIDGCANVDFIILYNTSKPDQMDQKFFKLPY